MHEMRNAFKMYEKAVAKGPFGRYKHAWKDSITIYLKEIDMRV
jgi:hypothetical protein